MDQQFVKRNRALGLNWKEKEKGSDVPPPATKWDASSRELWAFHLFFFIPFTLT